MNRSIRIDIAETADELKRLHKEQPDKNLAQRIWFLYLLKTGTLTRLSQGPTLLNQHRHTLRQWLNKYISGGLPELLKRETAPGPTCSIPPDLAVQFEEIVKGPGFTGGYREAYDLAQKHGWNVGYFAVRNYLRAHYGTKLKVARPQHHKQDPEALVAFKKKISTPKSVKPSPTTPKPRKSTFTSKTKADLDA